jgi:hypothetical protein
MREIYANREEALAKATMARKGAAVSLEAAGNRVRQRLEEILAESNAGRILREVSGLRIQ